MTREIILPEQGFQTCQYSQFRDSQEKVFFKQMWFFQLSDVSLCSENPFLSSLWRKTAQFNTWDSWQGTHYTALALQQPGFKSPLVPDATCKQYPGIKPGSLWAVLLSLTPQKQKQRKAIKVEFCVFCESQSSVCLRSQGSGHSGLQSGQTLFDP